MDIIKETARLKLKIKDSEPKPILLGRHLIERGMKPGAEFGPLLEQCFDAQLDGTFTDLDSGLNYLNQIIANTLD
jgi:tRNA nucleotidyltransferase (CCA-adding enzyme)